MNKKIAITNSGILILFFLCIKLYAQGIEFHGRTTNSIYTYETDKLHTRAYQFIRFELKHKSYRNICLNTSMRFLTDMNQNLSSDLRYKMYVLNLSLKKLLNNRMDLVIGRQFLHPGTVLGGLDGVFTKFTVSKHISLNLYGGVESHLLRSMKIYKTNDALTIGGLFQIQKIFSSKLQLLYLQKNSNNGAYWQIAGINFENRILPHIQFTIQSHYDLINSRFHRLLFSAKYYLARKMFFSLGYKSQYPQVYSNSFFTIFEPEAYRQYKLSCSYKILKDYFVSGQFQFIKFDTETANRLFLTLYNNNGSIGCILESGYAGSQLGVMFDYLYELTPDLIASVNVDYSRYRLEKVYQFENQVSNAARLTYKFNRMLQFVLEYQWLTNRYKKQDSRLLNHIHFSW